jgi:hypothetical protein
MFPLSYFSDFLSLFLSFVKSVINMSEAWHCYLYQGTEPVLEYLVRKVQILENELNITLKINRELRRELDESNDQLEDTWDMRCERLFKMIRTAKSERSVLKNVL